MSANSETMNYKLPVFLANDIPSWLTDWNGSMRKIDELIFNANSNISDLETKDTQIENTVNGLNDRVSSVENDLNPNGTGVAKDVATLETVVANHTEQLTELDTVTTNLTTLCGNTTLQTDNKTLTGAVNELNGESTKLINLCGNETLQTTAKTLTGAVNELLNNGTENDFEQALASENANLTFNYNATTGVKKLSFNIESEVKNKEFRVLSRTAYKMIKMGFSGIMTDASNKYMVLVNPPEQIVGQGAIAFHVSILEITDSGITYPSIIPNGVVYK